MRYSLNPVKPFGLPIVSVTAQPASGGGTDILVDRVIVLHSVPVPGLTHLGATAIHVIVVRSPVKILAAYLALSRPLIGTELA